MTVEKQVCGLTSKALTSRVFEPKFKASVREARWTSDWLWATVHREVRGWTGLCTGKYDRRRMMRGG
jgi:hypothetical protein